jgi:hypothetical protein
MDRVEVLERQLKRLQRFTVVLGIGFVWLIVWRLVPGPATVEAHEFRLRDGDGAIRGGLQILDDGRPVLRLNDMNGKARAMLYLNQERGGGLRLMDSTGERRLEAALERDGAAEVRISDEAGQVRTWVRLAGPERPGIVVVGEGGNPIWTSPPPKGP